MAAEAIPAIKSIEDGIEAASDAATNIGAALASGRYMYALQQAGIGEQLDLNSIDSDMVVAIANGDSAAIGMMAEQFQIDEIIVEALTAAVSQDLESVKECIPKLASIPGLDIDPDIAETIIMLAWDPQAINQKTAVKTAVVQFTKVMNDKLKQGVPVNQLDVDDEDPIFEGAVSQVLADADAQTFPQLNINPRVIEAVVDMANGNLSTLCDVLEKFEQSEYLPSGTGRIIEFFKYIEHHSFDFVNTLVELIEDLYPNIGRDFPHGLGCLVSYKY